MKQKIKVLLVDDHPLLRQGLAMVLVSGGFCDVIAEAGDGAEGWHKIQKLKPDVAILDLDLPGMNGLAVAHRVFQDGLSTKIIILTMHNKASLIEEALELGVQGFVLKDNAIQDILAGVKAVAEGKAFLNPSVSDIVMRRFAKAKLDLARGSAGQTLTKMEKRILRGVAENKTSKEIAAELGVSFFTVETHRKNICTKWNLRGPHALLNYALQNQNELALNDSSSGLRGL